VRLHSSTRFLRHAEERRVDVPANVEDALGTVNFKQGWVFDLNDAKNERAWAPYIPFILAIENRDHLWKFIRGDLYILVLVEESKFCQVAIDNGYEAQFESDRSLRITIPGTSNFLVVSSQTGSFIGISPISPASAPYSSPTLAKNTSIAMFVSPTLVFPKVFESVG